MIAVRMTFDVLLGIKVLLRNYLEIQKIFEKSFEVYLKDNL